MPVEKILQDSQPCKLQSLVRNSAKGLPQGTLDPLRYSWNENNYHHTELCVLFSGKRYRWGMERHDRLTPVPTGSSKFHSRNKVFDITLHTLNPAH